MELGKYQVQGPQLVREKDIRDGILPPARNGESASEATPPVSEYTVFSAASRRTIVGLCALAGFLSPFAAFTYFTVSMRWRGALLFVVWGRDHFFVIYCRYFSSFGCTPSVSQLTRLPREGSELGLPSDG